MPTTAKRLDVEDLRSILYDIFPDYTEGYDNARMLINRWIARGDGVAVYENHDLSSTWAGHKQLMSFGSNRAQLEVGVDDLPQRLPDIGDRINWRYQLVAVYYSKERL